MTSVFRDGSVRVRTVVFDLDGVLVDSRSVMERAFRHAFREVVSTEDEPPFGEYVRYLGWLFRDIMDEMGLPRAMEEPFVRESDRLVGEIEVCRGVPAVLDRLRAAGITSAVATGKVRARADRVLEATDLSAEVDAVVGSDEVARGKPAPDIFREALRRVDGDADTAIVVGDAPADIEGARAAGIETVAATWGECDEPTLLGTRPDHVAAAPLEVLGVIGLG